MNTIKVDIDIIPYSEENCVCVEYVPGADIQLIHEFGGLTVRANAEGLRFLAKVCLTLAQEDMPEGNHVHFDGFDFVRGDNRELTIERA